MTEHRITSPHKILSGSPNPMGATATDEGVNFAVFSANATSIDLCIFSEDGKQETTRHTLPERTGSIWHGFVQGLKPGALYGYRAHGSYAPDLGHRFNPFKLLMDPYTRELHGSWVSSDVMLGFENNTAEQDLFPDKRDSANFVPKSVVSDPDLLDTLGDRSSWQFDQELIYEAHVKGLTQQHPSIPDSVKGTYDGLASEAILDHLHSLNVTAIELLPVHSFLDDSFLVDRNMTNYWGYNSIGFFAPEPRYFGPAGFYGFRQMVKKFQSAGIDVILDVVYNHTAEGDHRGPTLCYRGLDNASYYRLVDEQPRYYINDTGCGNTLNVSHPHVMRMVLDSLRFWVECMGVNGFRFDLATTLAREDHGFDHNCGFLDALRQDPVLSTVRLIAEPWDIGPGGYRLGSFPNEFSEWNDGYRDTTRRYWRGDAHAGQELGSRVLASAENFDHAGRRSWSSLNFLTSHDGFTLADLTRYNERHNEKNTENNQDGHNSNYSDNCGVEGDTDDPTIQALRERRQRNLLATLFLSQGTPMLLAGDEIGNSQRGNNNSYCQDNDTGWVNWLKADTQLLEFLQHLSSFRAAHPALTQTRFLHGATRSSDGLPDVNWSDLKGRTLQWDDPELSSICMTVRCSAEAPEIHPDDDVVFIIFHRDSNDGIVTLPEVPDNQHWQCCIDTASDNPAMSRDIISTSIDVKGCSVMALKLQSDEIT